MTENTTPDPAEYALGDKPRAKRQRARLERATRRAEAVSLRRAGVRVDQIAAQFRVHPSTVHRWIEEAIRAVPREEAEDLRRMELDRLDALHQASFALAIRGDLQAVDRVLRVMERRARLLNLDQATTAGLEEVGGLLDRLVFGAEGRP